LFIYNTEAGERPEPERRILRRQFGIMIKRLWLGITWPSAIITLILGPWLLFDGGWHNRLDEPGSRWLLIKLVFVFFLYLYHFSLHSIYRQQAAGIFRYSSQKLRVWNEVATIFLVAIVILATVKTGISFIWALAGLAAFIIVLMLAIRIYAGLRKK
jgi:putative membrane protein